MDNSKNEVTLGQLTKVLKKSFKKILVYVIIVCVIVSALTLALREVVGTTVYSTSIQFKSTEEFVISTFGKNKTKIASDSAKAVFTDQDKQSLSYADKLADSLSISVSSSQSTKDNTDAVIAIYDITLEAKRSLGISKNTCKNLLDEIAKQTTAILTDESKLTAQDKTTVFTTTILDYNTASMADAEELLKVANSLYDRTNAIYASLTSSLTVESEAKSYSNRTTGKTLPSLVNEINVIAGEIEGIQAYIIKNGVTDDIAALREYISFDKIKSASDSANYAAVSQTNIELSKNYNSAFSQNGNTNNNNVTVDDSTFRELVSKANEALYLKNAVDKKLAIYNNVTLPAAGDSTKKEYVKQSLVASTEKLKTVISEYNDTVKQYTKDIYAVSNAEIVNTAYEYRENTLSMRIIVLLVVAAAFVSFAVVYIRAFGKMKESGELDNDMTTQKQKESDKTE